MRSTFLKCSPKKMSSSLISKVTIYLIKVFSKDAVMHNDHVLFLSSRLQKRISIKYFKFEKKHTLFQAKIRQTPPHSHLTSCHWQVSVSLKPLHPCHFINPFHLYLTIGWRRLAHPFESFRYIKLVSFIVSTNPTQLFQDNKKAKYNHCQSFNEYYFKFQNEQGFILYYLDWESYCSCGKWCYFSCWSKVTLSGLLLVHWCKVGT